MSQPWLREDLGQREDKSRAEEAEDPMQQPAQVQREAEAKAQGEAKTRGQDALSLAGVQLSNPDKVLYPAQGTTKRALAEYFISVEEQILPHAARRPLTLVRCPQGRAKKCFYQRHHGTGLPPGLLAVELKEKDNKCAAYLYMEDMRGLLSTVQIGVLELHLWGSRIDNIEQPDRMVFDLDPDESLDFGVVKQGAKQMRDALAAAELHSFPLLTGGKGIHLVVPILPHHHWSEVKRFSRGIARAVARQYPDDFIATASKARRKGKIFIDWLRNERGATAIAPYATRAKENCPIATPISWRELSRVRAGDQYNIGNIARRLNQLKADPWESYFDIEQGISAAALEAFGERGD